MRIQMKHAFTMMEMLLVVAVIMIVAAVMLPMGNKVLLRAKVSTVQKSLKDFETAVESYRQEYGRLPIPGGQNPTDQGYRNNVDVQNIMKALRGDSTVATIPNPKKINFFDSELVDQAGNYKSPWGDHIGIYFDANFDGEIDSSAVNVSVVTQSVRRIATAISPGVSGNINNNPITTLSPDGP